MPSARKAIVTSAALLLLRRRLRRSDSLAAPAALIALDLLGPRVFQLRRLLPWVLVLTVVGGVVAAAVWWALRRRSTGREERDREQPDIDEAGENGRAPLPSDRAAEAGGARLEPDPAVT